jgi:hypothetical protein
MSSRLKLGGVALFVVGLALWSSVAWSDVGVGGNDGGGTVSVGVATSGSTPGFPGPSTPGRRGSGPGPSCTYTPLSLAPEAGFALAPGGPTPGQWYVVSCSSAQGAEDVRYVWVPTQTTARPATRIAGVNPSAVATEAAASIVLPSPSIEINPAAFSVVNLATWLAVDPTMWHSYRATASVGGVTASATATPETVTWSMGDGSVFECDGPGTAYNPNLVPNHQVPSCTYTYRRSSAGEPSINGNPNDGSFAVTATVTWKVTWIAVGAAGGGDLPLLHTASTVDVRVEQVESVGIVP